MNILKTITPDIQIYSVDEAFLEVTNCMKIYKNVIFYQKKYQWEKADRELSKVENPVPVKPDIDSKKELTKVT